MSEHRKQALEWAEVSEDATTLAVTHALLAVADAIHALRPVVQPVPAPAAPRAKPSSKAKAEPEEPATNGHGNFKARHDPADWVKLEDGRWMSPTGRKYDAYSRPVIGVVIARKKRGLPV